MATPLDETLDREVLLMLQGPSPEQMALEFKSLLNKLVTKYDVHVCAYELILTSRLTTGRNY